MPKRSTVCVLAAAAIWLAGGGDAFAWGCDGHRAVVYIAERLLPASTRGAAEAVLTASPINSALARFCPAVPDDPLVDGAVWADDYRSVDQRTFGWHFINVPRQAVLSAANEAAFCPQNNCVVAALARQYRVLSTTSAAQDKADALRYIVHLIGDLHQPLHATTNGDRGGNCVPLTYYDRAPQESQTAPGDYSPNLHGVWDAGTIRTVMAAHGLADPRALADYIVARHALPAAVAATAVSKAVATAWARGSHQIGRTVVYATGPVQIPLEPSTALTLTSCADNHGVANRMLARHLVVDARYEDTTVPVILDQLRTAGIRLAAALKAAFPAR